MDAAQQVITIFLHLERLPLDNRGHRTLHPCPLTHNVLDLFGGTLAAVRHQQQVSATEQTREGDQTDPTAFFPASENLVDKHEARNHGSSTSGKRSPAPEGCGFTREQQVTA